MLSFKSGKISFQNKFSDKSKVPIETRAQREINACSTEKQSATIVFHKETKLT